MNGESFGLSGVGVRSHASNGSGGVGIKTTLHDWIGSYRDLEARALLRVLPRALLRALLSD